MDPLIVTALVSVVGSVSGIVGVVIGGRISASAADRAAKAAERQHFRDLGMQFAMVNFEHCWKMGVATAETSTKPVVVPPLKSFVIQGVKLMEIVADSSLSNDDMIKKIAECEDFAKSITLASMPKK